MVGTAGDRADLIENVQGISVSGIERVHAAIGGFQLTPTSNDYVRATVAALGVLETEA